MHIQEALLKAKQESFGSDIRKDSPTGQAIRRASWDHPEHRVYHGIDNMLRNDGAHTPHPLSIAELLADDWEVVPRFTSPDYQKSKLADRTTCHEPGCSVVLTDASRQKTYCKEHACPSCFGTGLAGGDHERESCHACEMSGRLKGSIHDTAGVE